jgi:hypothetical protein
MRFVIYYQLTEFMTLGPVAGCYRCEPGRDCDVVSPGVAAGFDQKPFAVAAHLDRARAPLADQLGATLDEQHAQLVAAGISVGRSSFYGFLKSLGLTRKKRKPHAAQQDRSDVAEAGAAWRKSRATLNPAGLVFLDETWTTANMARCHSRAPCGQRLVASVPHGHGKSSTFLAALRHDTIAAPCAINGPISSEIFRAYVKRFLSLRSRHRRDG